MSMESDPQIPPAPPLPLGLGAPAPTAPTPEEVDARLPSAPPPATPAHGLFARVRAFLKKHHAKLWWLHSAYAMTLGTMIVLFAQKGFQHARLLAITLGFAWLGLLTFFRLFGSGERAQLYAMAAPGSKARFVLVTYLLKNLYQGMLFFLLPFYWKSSSFDSPNRYFVLGLGACALLSTLDIIFDRVLMRWRLIASVFYAFTLFACLNVVIPAIFPNTRTVVTLLVAAGISVVGFAFLHVSPRALREPRVAATLAAGLALALGSAYALRAMIPPVPMHVASAAVGPQVLPDGRLAMEVSVLHTSVIRQLQAVTDVVIPGGLGDRLHHVWRHDGAEVLRVRENTARVAGPEGSVRLRSTLANRSLPQSLAGNWTVDVETEDGQLVGRARFVVIR